MTTATTDKTRTTRAEHRIIRQHLRHGEGNRRVVIRKSGAVEMTGSPDPFDRSRDGMWIFAGWADEILGYAVAEAEAGAWA